MYEDTMPSSLDRVALSNSLERAIELDEQLEFHPNDPDKGDSLPRRIASVADELVTKGVRPGLVGKLMYEPSLWKSLSSRQMLIAQLAAEDVVHECIKFVMSSKQEFFHYFSKWAPVPSLENSALDFAEKLLNLGVTVETEGAGENWSQYRPSVEELKAMAVLAAVMDPICWPSDQNFKKDISTKRTFKSYYFPNEFFHLLDAHYLRASESWWFFVWLHKCLQKYDYIFTEIRNSKLNEVEQERLVSLSPSIDYKHPKG